MIQNENSTDRCHCAAASSVPHGLSTQSVTPRTSLREGCIRLFSVFGRPGMASTAHSPWGGLRIFNGQTHSTGRLARYTGSAPRILTRKDEFRDVVDSYRVYTNLMSSRYPDSNRFVPHYLRFFWNRYPSVRVGVLVRCHRLPGAVSISGEFLGDPRRARVAIHGICK